MKVVKYQQKNTYTGKDGKERHYYGYSLVLDNGKQVSIRCVASSDYACLDAIAEYVSGKK